LALTGIHGDESQRVLGLLLAVEGAQQRDLAGRCVDPEQVGVAFLQEVANLIVERWRVGVVGLHGDHVTAVGNHIFHDVSEVGRVQERRLVVVDVGDGDNQLGGIEARLTAANIARTIFGTNRQRVARLTLVVEILRDANNARVLADAEVAIVVAARDREADATVGTFVDVGRRDLRGEKRGENLAHRRLAKVSEFASHLQHAGTDARVLSHRGAVVLRIEHRTVVVLVEHLHENLRLRGLWRLATIARRHRELIIGLCLAIKPTRHPQQSVARAKRERHRRRVRLQHVLDVSITTFIAIHGFDCHHHRVDGDVFANACLIRRYENGLHVIYIFQDDGDLQLKSN
jgi:hypothetical protein